MKIPVLKALANPAHIFFVPYDLAVFNFMIILILYVVSLFTELILTNNVIYANPLYFMIVLIGVHMILAAWSKKEPFLLRIIMAKLALFKKGVPERLNA